MKKLFKISIGVIVVMLLFLNVSLAMNDNKVEALSIDANTKTAQAWGGCVILWIWPNMGCECGIGGTECTSNPYCWGSFCAPRPEGK